jgi:NADH dehydrogenase FAD-containing subunit
LLKSGKIDFGKQDFIYDGRTETASPDKSDKKKKAASIESKGERVPGVAPAAMQMGKHAAAQIRRGLADRPTKPFRYRDKGSIETRTCDACFRLQWFSGSADSDRCTIVLWVCRRSTIFCSGTGDGQVLASWNQSTDFADFLW